MVNSDLLAKLSEGEGILPPYLDTIVSGPHESTVPRPRRARENVAARASYAKL
jgi:hypothetical protein